LTRTHIRIKKERSLFSPRNSSSFKRPQQGAIAFRDKALDVADRAYVLEQGKIVKEGKAKDVKADPAVRAAYLGTESKAGG